MREGFIFDYSRCVSCKACNAACILYNKWPVPVRIIFTYNSEADSLLPVISLSLACNHCETAVCMEGCPASAYSRDAATGAVIIDESKCIGCKYCQWNCPYDAPKYDPLNMTISKCNLCQPSLAERGQPACTNACPTGALNFGQIQAENGKKFFSWFPEKNMNPVIQFSPEISGDAPEIIPANDVNESEGEVNSKNIMPELSLLIFSFLSVLSVASLVSSFIKGIFPQKVLFIAILIFAGIVSLIHLGRKMRSWRAISNLRNSPLSREIAAFIIYFVISSLSVIFQIPWLLVAASVAGLVFLFLIDCVYIYSSKSKFVFLHSGQTLITALLIISFFSGIILPFVFLAILKIVSSVYLMLNKNDRNILSMRYLRMAFLVLPGISLIIGNSFYEYGIIFIFLAGELFDRILFYIDFNPLNINDSIREQLNIEKNEKKGN
jgi:Fe-S-cluster-containing dehydrogenase component